MKLIRFGAPGKEKPGISINDTWYDVSGFVRDYDEVFFAAEGLSSLREQLSKELHCPKYLQERDWAALLQDRLKLSALD